MHRVGRLPTQTGGRLLGRSRMHSPEYTPFDPDEWYTFTHPLWFSAPLADRSEYSGQVPGLHARFRKLVETILHGEGVKSAMLGRHIHKYWVTGPLDFTDVPSMVNFAHVAWLTAAVEVHACIGFSGNVDLRTSLAATRYQQTFGTL